MFKKNIIIIFIISIFLPIIAVAATVSQSVGGNVMFFVEPKNPGPNTQTIIKATSYAVNLSGANISWYLGDSLVREGVGADSLSFKTGNVGEVSLIRMVAESDTVRMGRAISIVPADIDIVWEADTYTPPLYRGKTLASPKSDIKIMAVPFFKTEKGTIIEKGDLNYVWKKGNSILLSGFGKNQLKTTVGVFGSDDEFVVTVSDQSNQIVAEKTIIIPIENTDLVFYKENPTEGTEYNNTLRGLVVSSNKEIAIRAEPYYFSNPQSTNEANLIFSWNLNGKGVLPNEGTPKIITLRNESGQDLVSTISLSIENIKKLFQKSSASFILNSTNQFNF